MQTLAKLKGGNLGAKCQILLENFGTQFPNGGLPLAVALFIIEGVQKDSIGRVGHVLEEREGGGGELPAIGAGPVPADSWETVPTARVSTTFE